MLYWITDVTESTTMRFGRGSRPGSRLYTASDKQLETAHASKPRHRGRIPLSLVGFPSHLASSLCNGKCSIENLNSSRDGSRRVLCGSCHRRFRYRTRYL